MTIDSSWLACFKEEAQEAFSPSCTMRPSAVFCDGQIHLMQGGPSEPQVWRLSKSFHFFVLTLSFSL